MTEFCNQVVISFISRGASFIKVQSILYTGLFSLHVNFTLLYFVYTFGLSWIRPDAVVLKEIIFVTMEFAQSPADYWGKMSENKMGAIIFIYTVCMSIRRVCESCGYFSQVLCIILISLQLRLFSLDAWWWSSLYQQKTDLWTLLVIQPFHLGEELQQWRRCHTPWL